MGLAGPRLPGKQTRRGGSQHFPPQFQVGFRFSAFAFWDAPQPRSQVGEGRLFGPLSTGPGEKKGRVEEGGVGYKHRDRGLEGGMRTGEQSGTECGCQAEVWVCVLVCALYLLIHLHSAFAHLCVPASTLAYVSCVDGGVFTHTHVHNGLYRGSLLGWICHPVLRPPTSTPRAPDPVAPIRHLECDGEGCDLWL